MQEDEDLLAEMVENLDNQTYAEMILEQQLLLNHTDDGLSSKPYKEDRCRHLKNLPLEPTVVYWVGGDKYENEVESDSAVILLARQWVLSSLPAGEEDVLKSTLC